MSKKKLQILITNDDGINAPGISTLIKITKKFANVVVVAPDKPQSGMGHAISVNTMLKVKKNDIEGIVAYSCTGTPVDCVKLAINEILKKKPDYIFSGINHGSNSSVNVIYSGTMSAAIEGAMENIPSVGFSFCNHSIDADLSTAEYFTEKIIKIIINNKLPQYTCLNVNIPDISLDLIKGIKVCRQANANWIEQFEKKIDNDGNSCYLLKGKFELNEKEEDTDEWALRNNYVSIVPIKYDLTDYDALKKLNNWKFDV